MNHLPNNKSSIKNDKNKFSLLPANNEQALKFLITVSEKLINVCDRETQALIQNDVTTFAILQDEKEILVSKYARASEEFRGRLEDFRSADKTLISKLETLQKQLGIATRSNSEVVQRMHKRSSRTLQAASLLSVQELAQTNTVRLPLNGHQYEGA